MHPCRGQPVEYLSELWVLLAFALFGLAFLIGAVYLSRIAIQLGRASASERAENRALLDRWLAGYVVVLGLLLVAVWDMVFKLRV